MNKFYDTLTNSRGDVLPGYRSQIVDGAGVVVDIFADRAGTRFTDSGGNVVNYATADLEGLVEFYWVAATGQTFQILDPSGNLQKSVIGVGDNYVLDNISGDLPGAMFATEQDAETGTDNEKIMTPLRVAQAIDALGFSATALASDEGAGMVGLPQGGTVADAVKWVTPEMFGAVGDGVTDDSEAVQEMYDRLETIGGGKALLGFANQWAQYLIGDVVINSRFVTTEGMGRCTQFVVKSGTTGITVKQDWVDFQNVTIISEGSRDDGLGTNAIRCVKDSGGSIGHFNWSRLSVGTITNEAGAPGNFSGTGVEIRNGLDILMLSCFFYKCVKGLHFGRNGTGAADFTTTVHLISTYAIACTDVGIDCEYVYRSKFTECIMEYNRVGIRSVIGDITLDRCYFEQNTEGGAIMTDTGGEQIDPYIWNATNDQVEFVRGVGSNSDWYTAGKRRGDRWSKRSGVQSTWGRDTKYLAGYGTVANTGLSYGTATVAIKRGPNLLNPKAWISDNGGVGTGTELKGWVASKGGYETSGSATGGRGMRQDVNLVAGQTYVFDWKVRNVSGSPLTIFRVGGVDVSNGVPFTAASTGPNTVLFRAAVSGAFENIIEAASLSQVDNSDATLVADLQDRLSTPRGARSEMYGTSAPTFPMAPGEFQINENAAEDGNNMVLFAWFCIGSGNIVPLYASTVSPAA